MRSILIAAILLLASPSWASCPLISLTPCKPAVHRVHKPKPNPAIAKHEERIASHDRWLAAHDAQFRAMTASIVSLQRQINELKAKR